ncbi:hypothetical protein BDZ97DRAFT_2057603 [Flammula alnicola]|nr:hypothetical protein BDZ97DRAFT_2057603 [Flammula alnicola]
MRRFAANLGPQRVSIDGEIREVQESGVPLEPTRRSKEREGRSWRNRGPYWGTSGRFVEMVQDKVVVFNSPCPSHHPAILETRESEPEDINEKSSKNEKASRRDIYVVVVVGSTYGQWGRGKDRKSSELSERKSTTSDSTLEAYTAAHTAQNQGMVQCQRCSFTSSTLYHLAGGEVRTLHFTSKFDHARNQSVWRRATEGSHLRDCQI